MLSSEKSRENIFVSGLVNILNEGTKPISESSSKKRRIEDLVRDPYDSYSSTAARCSMNELGESQNAFLTG